MSPDQLAKERRFGRVAAVAAVASGIALYVGGIWSQSIYADAPDNNDPAELRYLDRHSGEILVSAIVQAVGMLLLAVVALHLYRAMRARRPDEPIVVAVLGVYGPVALALVTVARAVALGVVAGDFADRSTQTLEAADDAFNDPALLIPQYLGISAVLALAFWLVKGSLDAMRVGLLSRVMGVIGIALGPAFVLGFGSLILPIWLIAVGVMFAGYWPRGLPPAWESGESLPWPSAQRGSASKPVEQPDGGRNGEVDPVGPHVRRAGRRSPSDRGSAGDG
jgi:MFS family permease